MLFYRWLNSKGFSLNECVNPVRDSKSGATKRWDYRKSWFDWRSRSLGLCSLCLYLVPHCCLCGTMWPFQHTLLPRWSEPLNHEWNTLFLSYGFCQVLDRRNMLRKCYWNQMETMGHLKTNGNHRKNILSKENMAQQQPRQLLLIHERLNAPTLSV